MLTLQVRGTGVARVWAGVLCLGAGGVRAWARVWGREWVHVWASVSQGHLMAFGSAGTPHKSCRAHSCVCAANTSRLTRVCLMHATHSTWLRIAQPRALAAHPLTHCAAHARCIAAQAPCGMRRRACLQAMAQRCWRSGPPSRASSNFSLPPPLNFVTELLRRGGVAKGAGGGSGCWCRPHAGTQPAAA